MAKESVLMGSENSILERNEFSSQLTVSGTPVRSQQGVSPVCVCVCVCVLAVVCVCMCGSNKMVPITRNGKNQE